MRFDELPELENVLDMFDVEEALDWNERSQLAETCSYLVCDYIRENPFVFSQPNYKSIIKESVMALVEDTIVPACGALSEEETELIFQMASYNVFTHVVPRRSYRNTFVRKQLSDKQRETITAKLESIRSRPQAEQCTEQWYIDRWNRLSGSNAWKAFGSQAQVNSLIYEKCKPLNTAKYKSVNVESPLHHGKRFEQVSTMLYEYLYQTKIEEFGCVPHEKHAFLGASPDGIVVNSDNPRYGRMLEIKNVTSRKISGIPKEDYWVQMQIQMEVCNLNECDFLETEMFTYDSYDDFEKDGTFQKSASGKYKGIIMFFVVDGAPYYEYPPFQCSQEEYETWEEEMMVKHKSHTWNCNIYYRIDTVSCVLVLRNKLWAEAALEKLREIWDIIVHERKNGYEHRQPKQRNVKVGNKNTTVVKLDEMNSNDIEPEEEGPAPCVLNQVASQLNPQKRPREAEDIVKLENNKDENVSTTLFVETETINS
jgi:hypothetical protein